MYTLKDLKGQLTEGMVAVLAYEANEERPSTLAYQIDGTWIFLTCYGEEGLTMQKGDPFDKLLMHLAEEYREYSANPVWVAQEWHRCRVCDVPVEYNPDLQSGPNDRCVICKRANAPLPDMEFDDPFNDIPKGPSVKAPPFAPFIERQVNILRSLIAELVDDEAEAVAIVKGLAAVDWSVEFNHNCQ